jgi:demethylmenaquinone methyltransferase/2-methoxy-6-polyprenyl-1,4-benzoquinol methylase
MSQDYYVPGADRAARVLALFDRIASRYDLINDIQSFGLHRLWKKRALKLASVQEGELALDLCSGTGDLALGLASAGARVIGCDFSEKMLSVAVRRSQSVCYVRGDALAIPARAEIFDLVTVGYGLRNLADLETGFRELVRVLKPGGRVLILDFGKPRNPVWRALYFAYLRMIVPIFGQLFCGDARAYRYILDSLRRYSAQEGVASGLAANGFKRVEVYNLLGGIMSIHRAEK